MKTTTATYPRSLPPSLFWCYSYWILFFCWIRSLNSEFNKKTKFNSCNTKTKMEEENEGRWQSLFSWCYWRDLFHLNRVWSLLFNWIHGKYVLKERLRTWTSFHCFVRRRRTVPTTITTASVSRYRQSGAQSDTISDVQVFFYVFIILPRGVRLSPDWQIWNTHKFIQLANKMTPSS